jgi:hypothetical protein
MLLKLASLARRNDQAERFHQTSDLIGQIGGDVDQLGACRDQRAREYTAKGCWQTKLRSDYRSG